MQGENGFFPCKLHAIFGHNSERMGKMYKTSVDVIDKLMETIDSLYIAQRFLGDKKEINLEDITCINGILKSSVSTLRECVRSIENEA